MTSNLIYFLRVMIRYMNTLKEKLMIWHLKERQKQKTTDDLFKVLNTYHPELPFCARTLISTPRYVDIQKMSSGVYLHFGLERSVHQAPFPFRLEDLKDLLMGSNGKSTVVSSGAQFYAIVGYFPELHSEIFETGVYHGYTKPHSANIFFQQTISEAKVLSEVGMDYGEKEILITISVLVADAPLRAWAKGVKSHHLKLMVAVFVLGTD